MKIKKPKKMIEAKREDIVLICTLGKESVFVMRRLKNGKYESKSTFRNHESGTIFDSSKDALEIIKELIDDYEKTLKSEEEDCEQEEV